ncbi:single-stranded DNA-binding protein [Mucilaginibacter antarcticus]|uniref:Single-stranded DNA-binding protein n=1 Tax=Mucilaginibacter antarcticus TaxID=1855725 RepID=A0ABW5XNA8_9SPHI
MLNRNTVNKVILMGYISNAPRWHKVESQLFLCFTLVTTERIKTVGEQQVHEEQHKVSVPANLADADVLVKGTTLYLQGRLQTKMVLDENKVRHYRSEIVALGIEPIEIKTPVLAQTAIH